MTVLSPEKRKEGSVGRFRWTVDTLYRAVVSGVFEVPERLELVHGDLWEREPVNPPHAATSRRIARLFRRSLEPAFLMIDEQPLRLSSDSEPTPDIYVAVGSEDDYETRHPTSEDARLVVEVADTTVERDTGEKARLYAEAGIAEYWVSLVRARELWVYRNPSPSGYPAPLVLRETDTISPLAAPQVVFAMRDLLCRAENAESVEPIGGPS